MNNKLLYMLENLPEETYAKDSGSNLYKLLDAIGVELELITDKLDELRGSKQLGLAKGESIDRIAKLLNMYRLFRETDEEFTARILARIPSFIGGGTIGSIEAIIRDYLKAHAVIVERYKEGNGFGYFDNGVIGGFKIKRDLDDSKLLFNIKSGCFYIDGKRYISGSNSFNLDINSTNKNYYIFANSTSGLVMKQANSPLQNEILLYHINAINKTYTINDERNILNPELHQITNDATISVQLAFNIDESVLTKEEVKRIIMETKAAGIAVLLIFSEVLEGIVGFQESINPFFSVGSTKYSIGTNNFIGYDRTFESLIEDGYDRFTLIQNLTPQQIGASTIGGIQ